MNKNVIYILSGLGLFLLIARLISRGMQLHLITKPFIKRGCDPAGCGYFGAPRVGHKHQGLDIAVVAGQEIYAPADLTFLRIAHPYPDLILSGAKYLYKDGYMKIFYMDPITSKKFFKKGDVIGYAQNVANYWMSKGSPQMTNHIHVELRNLMGKLLNPENYVV